MAATRITNPYIQYLDAVGEPLAAGTLTVYENGTTTLASIYSDAALTTPQSNPYTLSSLGQVIGNIFINETVRLLLKNSTGATIWQLDDVNVESDADSIINLLAAKGCAFTYADVISAGYTIVAGNVVRGSDGNTYKYNSGSVVDPVTDTPYDQNTGLSNSGAWTDLVIAYSPVTPSYVASQLSPIEANIVTIESNIATLQSQVDTPDYFSGLEISNNASVNKLDIASGSAMDSTNSYRMNLSSSINKSTSNFSTGTGNGGFPSLLTIATSTFYRVFLIAKADGTADVGFDSIGNSSASALLNDATDFIYFRQIGWIRTNASTATTIDNFYKIDNKYYWEDILEDRALAAASNSDVTITVTAPPNTNAELCVYAAINTNGDLTSSLRFHSSEFTVSSIPRYTLIFLCDLE